MKKVFLENEFGEPICELEKTKTGFYVIPVQEHLLLDVGDILKVVTVDIEDE